MSNLREKTISGIAWRGSSSIIQFIIQILISIVLMRYIGPDEYGIVAKIFIVMTVFNIILDFGFSQAIIQEKNVNNKYLASHFYISLFIGIILAIILVLISPLIANFYEFPDLKYSFYAFAGSLILGSSLIVHRALMHKAMKFRSLAIINISSIAISSIIAVFLAIKNYGYISVVVQLISATVIQAILFWLLSDFRPKRFFKLSYLKESSSFSVYLLITNFIRYGTDILDQFLVSIYYSQSSLGIYNRSIALIKRPARIIPNTFSSILFPLFSQYPSSSENTVKIHDIYYKTSGIIVYVITPFLLLYYLYAQDIIDTILGPAWYEIIEVSKIVALISIVSIQNIEAPIYLSKGKSKQLMQLILVTKLLLVVAIFIGIRSDLQGLLYAMLISEIITRIIRVLYINRIFSVKLLPYIKSIGTSFMVAIIMSGIIYFSIESCSLSSLGNCIGIGVLLLVLHFLTIYALPIGAPREIKNIVFKKPTK